MEKAFEPECSVLTHRVDGGVLIRISGKCSKENVMAIRDAITGHVERGPNFTMFEVSNLTPERVEDFVELCKDILSSKPRLFLIGPNPEIRAELHKEIEESGYEVDYWVCDSLKEAMDIARKKAA